MTREEAIEALNEIFDDSEFSRYEAWYGTAMKMAIEALQAEPKIKENKMTNRENCCIDCKHIDKMTEEEPCKRCRNNYTNLWEPVPKVREFTEDELIGAFRDAFVERRAIGILDIENKVKELFE